jgi:hypothetical protein
MEVESSRLESSTHDAFRNCVQTLDAAYRALNPVVSELHPYPGGDDAIPFSTRAPHESRAIGTISSYGNIWPASPTVQLVVFSRANSFLDTILLRDVTMADT